MNKEHTEGKLERVLGVLTVLAAIYGLVQMLAAGMMWKGKQWEKENEKSGHKRFLSFMNGASRRPIGKVDSVTLFSVMGGTELDLTGAELGEYTRVSVRSAMAGVVIKVPPMVEVVDDSKSIMSGVANMVPHYSREGLPVVHVDSECLMSGISIKMVCEEE